MKTMVCEWENFEKLLQQRYASSGDACCGTPDAVSVGGIVFSRKLTHEHDGISVSYLASGHILNNKYYFHGALEPDETVYCWINPNHSKNFKKALKIISSEGA